MIIRYYLNEEGKEYVKMSKDPQKSKHTLSNGL